MIERYYHGGVPGLRVGDRILPPSVTGKGTLLSYSRELEGGEVHREDRVYVARTVDLTIPYAYVYPHGGVYRVAPDSPVEPDEDATDPGYSFQARGATVLSVINRGNPRKAKFARRKVRRMNKKRRPPTPPPDEER